MIAKTFRTSLAAGTALALAFAANPAMAQLVSSGDLVTAQDSAGNPNQITVTNPNASTANISVLAPVVVANWTQFNVPVTTTLNIHNASGAAQASLLNRVIGGGFSDIGGTINAPNINLWLMNQNGIIFGSGVNVNAGSFFASSLDTADADFFDFYEGTDLAGNGSRTVQFASPVSSFVIASGGSFNTTGDLVFIGAGLSLLGNFNAQSGTAAFVSANDVAVSFNPGSPLSYTVNAGTVFSDMEVSGTVTAGSANFALLTAPGVTNAVMNIGADVTATAASASDLGIMLHASGMGAEKPSIKVGGLLSTNGRIDAYAQGDWIAEGNITGADIDLRADGALNAADITATSEDVRLTAASVNAATLRGANDVIVESSGAVSLTSATADSDNNRFGRLLIGASRNPSSLSVTGALSGAMVYLRSVGAISLGNVTATNGALTLSSAGSSITAGSISATGDALVDATGSVRLSSANADSDRNGAGTLAIGASTLPSSLTVTGASQGAAVDLQAGGDVTLGGVASFNGTTDILSTGGSITAGGIAASGGNIILHTNNGAITTGALAVDWIGQSINLRAGGVGGNIQTAAISSNGGDIQLSAQGSITTTSIATGTNFPTTDPAQGTIGLHAGGAITTDDIAAGEDVVVRSDSTVSGGSYRAGDDIDVQAQGAITLAGAATTAAGIDAFRPQFASGGPGSSNLVFGAETLTGSNVVLASLGGSISVGTIDQQGAGGKVSLQAAGAVTTGDVGAAGAIDIDSTAGGAFSLGALSAGGDITLDTAGSVGLGSAVADRDADGAGNLFFGQSVRSSSVSVSGALSGRGVEVYSAGNISIASATVTNPASSMFFDTTGGSFSASGALTGPGVIVNAPLGSATFGGIVTTNDLGATLGGGLTANAANNILRLNGITAGGAVSINNANSNLYVNFPVNAGSNDVTIQNTGDLTIDPTAQITGNVVALSAGGNFYNYRGADAIVAGDHWVVYSNAPGSNVYGGLDSGNTAIWNSTIATLAPGAVSGNRYVFAFQPTVVVSSTDTSKVYGTNLTGALNAFYTVSGLQPGVAGAFLGDTQASVLSGAPEITSAGAVANADVAGGPYVMTVGQGSLAVSNGYSLVLSHDGRLTITPKPITGTVNANDKTYDGTTAGSGSVALNGVIAGDSVGTSGTTFTFSDKNAGTDKTVTVSGTSLTGADAANYTLTVPASVVADILAKAITATVNANDKTYDGTTAGSGSVALNGVIAGDSVGTSGTTFTFSDKNAGTDKTVTVSGTSLTGADAANYTLTVPASALADILARLLIITANDQAKPEGAEDPALTYQVGGQGLVAGDAIAGSLSRNEGEAPGSYAITQGSLTAGGNYTIRFEGGVLTITPAPVQQKNLLPVVPLRSMILPGDLRIMSKTRLRLDQVKLCPDGDKSCASKP